MVAYCIVKKCFQCQKAEKIRLFRFPSNKQRRTQWAVKCDLPYERVNNNSRICESHFDESQFEQNRADGWKKLKSNAVPTLFDFKPDLKRPFTSSTSSEGPLKKVAKIISSSSPDPSFVKKETPTLITISQCQLVKEMELQSKIEKLEQQLAELNRKNENLSANLKKIFSDEQIAFLSSNDEKHRWSKEAISNALRLRFALGKNGYSYLTKQKYPFPSYSTLVRRIHNVKFDFGVFMFLKDALAARVLAMEDFDKECVLCIGEMRITKKLENDKQLNKKIGRVTLGDEKETGNNLTVFLLRGLNSRWKQIIAADVTGSSTDGPVLSNRVKEIIDFIGRLGFNIRAIVSDMSSTNRSLWMEQIFYGYGHGKRIHVFADVQHLLKKLKSAVLNTDWTIKLPASVVEADSLPSAIVNGAYIKQLWEFDRKSQNGPRYLLHIQRSDIYPKHFQIVNVNSARRFFSIKTAQALQAAVENNILSADALTTAWFVRVICIWYRLVASRSQKLSITRRNFHQKTALLNHFVDIIRGLEIGQGWKCLNSGLVLSTLAFISIANELFESDDYQFLLGSRICQDALENVFSQIQRKTSDKPTALQAKRALKLMVQKVQIT